MRKAIALFITLSVITLVSLIILKNITTSNNALNSKNNPGNMMQTFQVLKDVEKFIKIILPKIENSKGILRLTQGYIIPYGDILFNIKFEIVSNKININDIIRDDNHFSDKEKIVLHLFDSLEIGDSQLLFDIILDTIDKDLESRNIFSEIAYRSMNFANSQVFNEEHFRKIIDRYYEVTQDKQIKEVKFNEIFYFGDINKSFPLMSVRQSLFLTEGIDYVDSIEPDLNISQSLDIKSFFSKSDINNMLLRVKVKYKVKSLSGFFDFFYDTKTKKITKLFDYN
ncbi:MAG: Unknown protein [uncultured Campylobacterales bacterium]|uniref:Uncharacterized protein n=1 Tax=uncultured Campylobacterales bacterium TaxID=352960 RepID=A0A6S6S658_9BACT|nr:MAG: Unknown protein [uncultured Campylobacterales bacterium]